MFLTSPETDTKRRRRWSLKTTVASLGAMMLTSAGLALLPTTAAAAADLGPLQAAVTQAENDLSKAEKDIEKANGDITKANADLTKANEAVAKATADLAAGVKNADKALERATGDVSKATTALDAANLALTSAQQARTKALSDLETARQNLATATAENEAAKKAAEEKAAAEKKAAEEKAAAEKKAAEEKEALEKAEKEKAEKEKEKENEGKKPEGPICELPLADAAAGVTGEKDPDCDEGPKGPKWEGCERPSGNSNLSAEDVQALGDRWEKECWYEPTIKIDVIKWCPLEVEVKIGNLKHWLDYEVYINGKPYTIDSKKDYAKIVVKDFKKGNFEVVVKYKKDWGNDRAFAQGNWGKHGEVKDSKYIKERCGDWHGCKKPSHGDNKDFSAESAREWGDKWEKDCWIQPDIDIKVKNWCPTVVKVELSNLKHWLKYKVYVNGERTDIEIHDGKAWIKVDDFDHGLFEVVVKYQKKHHSEHKSWERNHWFKGKVSDDKYIHEYDCPVIDHEVEKKCHKIDGKSEIEIQVTNLDDDRKYVVIVKGDDYKKVFFVHDRHSFYKDVKLEEGHYTVIVKSVDGYKHGDRGDDLSVQGGGGHYDHADVGPVKYDFKVKGCPVDVTVEPTENCKSIKAVLDTLVEGRKYIVKVKDSEGDVVFEKTVWGPTTIDQKFHKDTYTVIVIDVKARDHGDRDHGWDHDWDGHDWDGHKDDWNGHKDHEVLTAYNVGDEVPYDKDRGDYDGHDGDKDDWGHGHDGDKDDWGHGHDGDKDDWGHGHHGKKGKGLKWTATITISDCETPDVVPAGETPDHSDDGDDDGGTTVVVGGTGGGVLATTGADPAGMALAALILLPVGGAVLATRSVIARRKNAA